MKIGRADPEILRLRANKSGKNRTGCHGDVPWDIEKKFRSVIYTQNAFIWYKNCKNRMWFCFAYDTKLVAMATSLEESEKLDRSRKFTQIPYIWWKDRENRSSSYWHSFAHSKKKKKLTRAKYIARSARPARQVCRAGYIRPTIILFILSHTRTRSVAADMKHRQYLASQAYTVRLPIGHSLLRSLNQNSSSRLAY